MRNFTSLTLVAAALLLTVPTVQALDCGGSCNASNASAVMSEGLGLVVEGTLSVVAASGQVTIESVQHAGDAVVLVVRSVAKAGELSVNAASEVTTASLKLTGKAVKKVAFVAGQTLEISAVSTGHFLVLSGKALAFIPNAAGQALLSHEKVKS